jgi:hypothetical protein
LDASALMKCTYCGQPTQLVTGAKIYPHLSAYHDKLYYSCQECNAYVGCHKDGTPLGTPANARLRWQRQQVHSVLDPIWKSGRIKRSAVYAWLAQRMQLTSEQCHVGMFDENQCRRAQDNHSTI